MRTDIPQAYLDAFADPKRWRLQYMVLHWPDGDQYIAGSRFEYSGGKYCDALVVDWGNLSDTVDVEAAIIGTGSQTRQASVTLANTSETGWWCSRFSTPPENLSVDLYQAVEGVGTHLLIGRFIVQSPIDYSEAEGTVTLTLLSVNQRIDPYVGTLDPVTNEFYPVIIGSLEGVAGSLYGTHPLAKLDGDIEVGATTIKADRDLAAAGWPTSGQLMLDFETVSYTGRSGVYFTGVSGVAKTHDSGQWVFQKGHEYLFAFGAGPVALAGPVYVNNEVYAGQYTIYGERNPVQVGFLDGFPFSRLDETEVVSHKFYASDLQVYSGVTAEDAVSGSIVVFAARSGNSYEAARYSYIPVSPGIGYTFSSIIIDIGYQIEYIRAARYSRLEVYYPDSSSKVLEVNANLADKSGVFSNSYLYQGALLLKLFHTSDSSLEGVVGFLKNNREIKVYWNKPGFPKKQFYDIPSLNIGTEGSTSNPADVISMFLIKKGCAGLIDSVSFNSARLWYQSAGYSMAGPVDGGKRCSEVLNEVCWMCRSFLVYDADKVFLHIRYSISSTPVTYASQLTNRKKGSLRITRQDFSKGSTILGSTERQDGVVNSLTIRYAARADGIFAAQTQAEDVDSIATVGKTEQIMDAYLVPDPVYAENLVAFWLGERAWPYSIMSLTATGLDGMLLAQLGDAAEVFTDWSNIGRFLGRIVGIDRQFGQAAPSPRPNEWNIKIAGVL